jgi:Bacterial PH domain
MAGPARYLAHDERLVLSVRRHASLLIRPGGQVLLVVVVASAIGYLTSPEDGGDFLDTVVGVAALATFARFAWKLWEWWADRIVVTDHRIFEVSGLITRRVASMPLRKVTDMTYRRSLGGRLLGYGDLILESAGQDQALGGVHHIPKPDHFYRTVTSLVTSALGSVSVEGDDDRPPSRDTAGDDMDTGPLPRVTL